MQEFDRIYHENFIKVYRYILSMSGNPHLAEDITQETFFKALQKLDSFHGDCTMTTWLCRIARNLYLNQVKRQTYVRETIKTYPPEEAFSTESTEDKVIRKEKAAEIIRAMQKLDDTHKEVFSLRMFSELSFRDIGKEFGKSDNWARVTFYRAKLKVKEELKDENKV